MHSSTEPNTLLFHTVYSLRVALGNQHTTAQCHPNLRIPEVVPTLQTFIHSSTAELVRASIIKWSATLAPSGQWRRLALPQQNQLPRRSTYHKHTSTATKVPFAEQDTHAGTILGAPKLGHSPLHESSLLQPLKENRHRTTATCSTFRKGTKPHMTHSIEFSKEIHKRPSECNKAASEQGNRGIDAVCDRPIAQWTATKDRTHLTLSNPNAALTPMKKAPQSRGLVRLQ